ncbi:MAG: hypothetical protein KAS38_04490, partial [Anaerolineales bacterium]|nr:hypothetical protein [Anaerolineales bacterium]
MGSNLAKRSLIILVGIIIFSSILLIGATLDIFHMAQGTGNYLWGFSFNKGLAFIGSVITSAIIFLGLIFAAWKWERSLQIAHNLTTWRD